jgi:hypothetical protein
MRIGFGTMPSMVGRRLRFSLSLGIEISKPSV